MMPRLYTVPEIVKIYKEEKPRFISLRDANGMNVCTWNSPTVKVDQKFKEINDTLKSSTIAPGIYYYIQKKAHPKTKNATEQVFPVAVGDASLKETPAPAPALPEVWTQKQALEILDEKNRLTYELKNALNKIKELEERIQELETEDLSDDDDDPETAPSWIDGLSQIITTLAPSIDKHFQLREKELNILAMKYDKGHTLEEKSGRILPMDPTYADYLDNLIRSQDMDSISSELTFLRDKYPDTFKKVVEQYQITFQ